MPPLTNPRHEKFAQGLAKQLTSDEAYSSAGFKPNRGNATRLKANESVQARVSELLNKSAQRTLVTIESIAEELELARLLAMNEAVSNPSAAVAASMGKAKLFGLLIDKSLTAQTSVEDLLDQLDGKAG